MQCWFSLLYVITFKVILSKLVISKQISGLLEFEIMRSDCIYLNSFILNKPEFIYAKPHTVRQNLTEISYFATHFP